MERTDSSGQVQFLLPADSYKFRVDYDGTQYWSDVISIIPHEENSIDLQLELLADLTHDPRPDRFDGMPPEYEPEKIMVASLGSIRGLLVQSVVGQTTETQKIYYFINDHLGTPQKLLDENADVVWSADYKPFGEADVDVNAFTNQFRFPGQYFDSETGLHYNWFRYYDPSTGRYLRADPIGLDGSINLFPYANANPINAIDPWGLFKFNAEYLSGGAVYANFRVSGAKLSATIDLGTQHTPLYGPKYVSQGASIEAEAGPINIGLGAERIAIGESHGYSFDKYGRVIPGTGLSVNDILRDTPFEVYPLVSWGSVEWAQITIGAQFLIGAEITLDFRDEAMWWGNFISNFFSDDPCKN
ncbi:MAG: hypothetical protein GY797_18425 [Deltaproteobacteria bacterium]|nr:hypothetical protein [Deltaproteobacteria bacterium]